MNDIRIYDYEFNLLHIEPNIMSAYWILKYNDIGTFEGTFPLTSGICDVVMKNKYLILVQGELQSLITAYLADTKLTVYGKTLNWILTRRTFQAFDAASLSLTNKQPGTIANYIVSSAFSDVDNFDCVNLIESASDIDFDSTSRDVVSSLVKSCLEKGGFGHRVRVDILNKKWIFETYAGRELPLIITEADRNFTDVSISDDAQNFFNSAWYNMELKDMGNWYIYNAISPPSQRPSNYGTYYHIVNQTNYDYQNYPNGAYLVCTHKSGAWSVFSELPTVEDKLQGDLTGIYDWDTFCSSTTIPETQTELSDKKWTHTLKGSPVRLKYNIDYSLGDIVRIQVQKGSYTEDAYKTVSSVDIWWENGSIGQKMNFEEDGYVI